MKSRRQPVLLYLGLSFLLIALLVFFLLNKLQEHYQESDPILFEIKQRLRLLDPRANKLRMFESNKSYTINKKRIYLCLKDQDDKYYPMNMLMYVAIHELAHVLCQDIGHTPKFQQIFKQLLEKAKQLGIYDPQIPVIRDYCGYGTDS